MARRTANAARVGLSGQGCIRNNGWATWSVLMVMCALAANIVGAWLLREQLRKRVDYSESNKERWQREYEEYSQIACPWRG